MDFHARARPNTQHEETDAGSTLVDPQGWLMTQGSTASEPRTAMTLSGKNVYLFAIVCKMARQLSAMYEQ